MMADPLDMDGLIIATCRAGQEAGFYLTENEARAILTAVLPLVLAGPGEALEPLAWIAENDIGETEDDKDRFKPMFIFNRAPWLVVGDFRRARSEHARIDSLIGESKGER